MIEKTKNKEEFTKYETARILGARALQIAMDAPLLLKINKEKLEEIHYDPLKITEMEFEEGVLPITVKRPMPKKVESKLEREKEDKQKEKELRKKEQKEQKEIEESGEIMELAKNVEEDEEDTVEEEIKKPEEEGV